MEALLDELMQLDKVSLDAEFDALGRQPGSSRAADAQPITRAEFDAAKRDDARQRRRSRRRLLREILQLPTRLTIPGATRRNRWLRRRLGLASLLARARHVLAQHEHVVACEPFQLAELRRSRSVAAAARWPPPSDRSAIRTIGRDYAAMQIGALSLPTQRVARDLHLSCAVL